MFWVIAILLTLLYQVEWKKSPPLNTNQPVIFSSILLTPILSEAALMHLADYPARIVCIWMWGDRDAEKRHKWGK